MKSDRLSLDEDRLREDYSYEALALSRRTIDLEFDEETMKPEKPTEAPRNAGTYPGTDLSETQKCTRESQTVNI